MNTDSRSPIEHIIVLMLENRSYDHMLGYLPNGRGLTGDEFNLVDPSDPSSQRVRVSNKSGYVTAVDPAHDFVNVEQEMFGEGQESHAWRALLGTDALEKWRRGEVDQEENSEEPLSTFQEALVGLADRLNQKTQQRRVPSKSRRITMRPFTSTKAWPVSWKARM